MQQNIAYISLGSDCSVSYQLRKLGLQKHGSMPFDWMRIDNLLSVISILEDEFRDFARFESYNIKQQSLAFDYFGSSGASMKSEFRMVHSKYKFILPHEYQGSQIEPLQFEEKYSRRIARFLDIGRNPALPKVFIRLGSARDTSNLARLQTALDNLGCVNYKVQYINLEDYNILIPKDEKFGWQRDYIPWNKIFI